jgi:hypothetical protein
MASDKFQRRNLDSPDQDVRAPQGGGRYPRCFHSFAARTRTRLEMVGEY